MKQRRFGKTGWEVGEIGFGGWAIGADWGLGLRRPTPWPRSTLRSTPASRCSTPPTCTATAAQNDSWPGSVRSAADIPFHIVTKAGRRLDPHVADGYTEANLTAFVDRSLTNLDTDTLDLVQLHCPPTDVYYRPELFEAMDRMVEAGKIAYWGVSVERVEEALKAIEWPTVASVQIIFNMFRLRPAERFFAEAAATGCRHPRPGASGFGVAHREDDRRHDLRRRRPSNLQPPRRSVRRGRNLLWRALRRRPRGCRGVESSRARRRHHGSAGTAVDSHARRRLGSDPGRQERRPGRGERRRAPTGAAVAGVRWSQVSAGLRPAHPSPRSSSLVIEDRSDPAPQHLDENAAKAVVVVERVVELGRDPARSPALPGPAEYRYLESSSEDLGGDRQIALVTDGASVGRPASGRATREPTIESGAGRSIPSASVRRARGLERQAPVGRPARPATPPTRNRPLTSSASGIERYGVGSTVPTQSKRRRNAEREEDDVVEPMADRERDDAGLAIPPHVQKCGAFRGAHPLVAVACVVGGTERLEVEWHHAGGVSAVDEGLDPPLAASAGTIVVEGEHDPGGTGDMVEQHQSGAVA